MRYSRIPAGVGAVLCVASACGERAPAVDTAQRDTASAAGVAALPAAAGRCDAPSAGAVRVSDDSIAYLGADATMGELRARCPAAGDTVNAAEHGTNPALVFRFDGASALVWQNGPVLDLARSADGWTVSGPAVRIADSIPLTAPWATIRRAMGDSATAAVALQANGQPDRGSVVVRFCAHPLVAFRLPLAAASLGVADSVLAVPVTAIPDSAHAASVSVLAGINRRAVRRGGESCVSTAGG